MKPDIGGRHGSAHSIEQPIGNEQSAPFFAGTLTNEYITQEDDITMLTIQRKNANISV